MFWLLFALPGNLFEFEQQSIDIIICVAYNKNKQVIGLKYRDGKNVVSRYVSKKEMETVHALIEKRRHMEAIVKSLQEEKAIADKVLEGAV